MSNNTNQTDRARWWAEIQAGLAEPFSAEQVNWKPQRTWNHDNWDDKDKRNHTNAQAVAFLDARRVADRLDAVLTPGGWQVEHRHEGGQLLTGLGVYDPFLESWLWKWDGGHVDGHNDDHGQVTKGTLSDGLKRAAVLWGVGRIPADRLGCDLVMASIECRSLGLHQFLKFANRPCYKHPHKYLLTSHKISYIIIIMSFIRIHRTQHQMR
jgi:hypothetical protein